MDSYATATKKILARARASARALRDGRKQGDPIIHPLTNRPCGTVDFGDALSHTYGLVGGRVVHVSLFRGNWTPTNVRAIRHAMFVEDEDGNLPNFHATEVWAVRLADDSPVQLF